jgi:type IV secretion system protein VirB4
LSFCAASSRQHQALIAEVHARSGTDGFLAAWLRENRLAWAADMIADLTNVIPQTKIPEVLP